MIRFIIPLIFLLITSAKANELEKILDQANKYTVKISNSTNTPFIEDSYNASFGSGILIDKTNGIIITNAHVSSYSPSINRVNFKYSDPMQSKQIYIDPEIDLAFLQVDPKSIPKEAIEAKLQCKNDYKQGQNVVAFGHPNGKDFTITRGIISAIRYETDFFESIQTDAAINGGNSGGALIDISSGLVVGINSFGATDAEGLNFALPSYTACKVLELYKNKKDPSPLDFQVLFSDTPGIIKPAYELQNSMMDFVKSAFEDADILVYMVEIGEKELMPTTTPELISINAPPEFPPLIAASV